MSRLFCDSLPWCWPEADSVLSLRKTGLLDSRHMSAATADLAGDCRHCDACRQRFGSGPEGPGIRRQDEILLMSGYSDTFLEVAARARFPFIRKPFLPDDLLRKVTEVLGR